MKEFLKKAKKAERARDYSTAGDFYSLAGDMKRALYAYRRGGLHEQAAHLAEELGDYPAAAEYYVRGKNLRAAAEMWIKAEQPDRAWRLYKRAGDMMSAGEILEKMGNPVEAAEAFEQANLKDRAASLYARHDRPAEAIRLLETLIAETERNTILLDPVDRNQQVRRFAKMCGKLYLKLGNSAGAAPLLQRAGLLEECAEAFKKAGEVSRALEAYLKAGRDEEAARLVDSQPSGVFEPRLLADLFLRRGNDGRAAEHFLAIGEHTMACECFERSGQMLKAAEAAQAARDLHGAARLYGIAGEWKKAADLYREAHAPAEAAACLEKAGEVAAAVEDYVAAGDFLKSARILFQRGELDRCIELLQRITREADDAEDGSLLLGEIFEKKVLFSLAADCYRRGLNGRSAEPDTLPILYRLARVLEKSGRPDEALPLYQQIAAVDFRYEDVADRVTALSQGPASIKNVTLEEGLELGTAPLEERFEVAAEIGREQGGVLYSGREKAEGRPVVIYRFPLDPVQEVAKASRLLQEAERLERLRHPGIAPLLGVGVDDQGLYYAFERREGKTLREVLREGGAPDFGTVVSLLARLAEALDYAHAQGCLCRNLRPESVLITSQQEVMILGYGLALRLTEVSQGDPDDSSLLYVPPELLLRERMDSRSDLYCLGLIGLEISTGQPPSVSGVPAAAGLGRAVGFPDPPPRRIPALVRQVVERCLQQDRGRRYASASELLAQLQGAQFLPGTIVANRYEVVREAGRGGMGEVYEARDLVLEERVALKTISGALDVTAQRRFLNEIKVARKITHPNVVRVFTFEQWRDLRFIVMEYIEGMNLMAYVERHGVPPVSTAASIGCGIAQGLEQAHELGVVHRDIKPDNILLDPDGKPRILDFGIARASDNSLTQAGMTIGSPKYMSPEQVEGKPVDGRSDLYSLGLVLYFLFTGRETFASGDARSILMQQIQKAPDPPRSLRPDLPQPLERLLLSMLAKDPAQRPQSAQQVAAALSAFAASPTPALTG